LYWLRTSRVSICASRSPGFTRVPVSTFMRVIMPDALDFTSTTVMGSTTPLACASTTMSRRVTGAVCTVAVVVAFRPQAGAIASVASAAGMR
jgi:hypothetical protein